MKALVVIARITFTIGVIYSVSFFSQMELMISAEAARYFTDNYHCGDPSSNEPVLELFRRSVEIALPQVGAFKIPFLLFCLSYLLMESYCRWGVRSGSSMRKVLQSERVA